MHCDFAFWVGGTHDNVADMPELERLPGAAGIKVFMGSSTGNAAGRRRRRRAGDPEGDPPPRGLPQRGRGAAQRAQASPRRMAIHASHPCLARRNRPRSDRTEAPRPPGPRGACAGARAAYLHRARRWRCWPTPRTSQAARRRRNHLTLSAEDYPRLGARLQMNPPVRGARPSRRNLARPCPGRRRRARLRPRAPYARREGEALSRKSVGHARRADARSGHARPCQRGAADFAALRRSHQRRARTASSISSARAGSRRATTPTSPWSI